MVHMLEECKDEHAWQGFAWTKALVNIIQTLYLLIEISDLLTA